MSEFDKYNNSPCVPLHLQARAGLIKSSEFEVYKDQTDYSPAVTIAVPEETMGPSYNAPRNRPNGNVMFRRYPDGQLDVDAARDVAVASLDAYRLGFCTSMDAAVLVSIHGQVEGQVS